MRDCLQRRLTEKVACSLKRRKSQMTIFAATLHRTHRRTKMVKKAIVMLRRKMTTKKKPVETLMIQRTFKAAYDCYAFCSCFVRGITVACRTICASRRPKKELKIRNLSTL